MRIENSGIQWKWQLMIELMQLNWELRIDTNIYNIFIYSEINYSLNSIKNLRIDNWELCNTAKKDYGWWQEKKLKLWTIKSWELRINNNSWHRVYQKHGIKTWYDILWFKTWELILESIMCTLMVFTNNWSACCPSLYLRIDSIVCCVHCNVSNSQLKVF